MPGLLRTKPLCILTSGYTADGREVLEQTLLDIAETYNPKTYNARINIEHSGYGYKAGSVISLAVKDAVVNDVQCKQLFAELEPNDYFLYLAQQGQKVHTSAEITPNFAKTNKSYLTGLALTDDPASLGTDEIKFSANNVESEHFSTGESFSLNPKKTKFIPSIFNNNKDDDDMADKAILEILSQINKQAKDTQQALSKLDDKLEKLSANKESSDNDDTTNKDKVEQDSEAEQLSILKSEVKLLSENLTAMTEKLAKQTDEPYRKEATGGNEDDNTVL